MLPLPGAAGLPATRSTNDRMFVFVNKRPVAFVDITKVIFYDIFKCECFNVYCIFAVNIHYLLKIYDCHLVVESTSLVLGCIMII